MTQAVPTMSIDIVAGEAHELAAGAEQWTLEQFRLAVFLTGAGTDAGAGTGAGAGAGKPLAGVPVFGYLRGFLGNDSRFATGYHLWTAEYRGTKGSQGGQDTYAVPSPATISKGPQLYGGWPAWSIWQYAVTPGVPGIGTQVDRDLIFLPVGLSVLEYLNGPPPGNPVEAKGITI
jgi:hypothetical protein